MEEGPRTDSRSHVLIHRTQEAENVCLSAHKTKYTAPILSDVFRPPGVVGASYHVTLYPVKSKRSRSMNHASYRVTQ